MKSKLKKGDVVVFNLYWDGMVIGVVVNHISTHTEIYCGYAMVNYLIPTTELTKIGVL